LGWCDAGCWDRRLAGVWETHGNVVPRAKQGRADRWLFPTARWWWVGCSFAWGAGAAVNAAPGASRCRIAPPAPRRRGLTSSVFGRWKDATGLVWSGSIPRMHRSGSAAGGLRRAWTAGHLQWPLVNGGQTYRLRYLAGRPSARRHGDRRRRRRSARYQRVSQPQDSRPALSRPR
jgi:hypothetical protein